MERIWHMKKRTGRLLIGTGLVAAGAGIWQGITRVKMKYMMKLALDREEPAGLLCRRGEISGNVEREGIEQMLLPAQKKLESQDHERIEIQSNDGVKLVGHWFPADSPKRILIAMHGWRSNWARDFGLIADFWRKNGCSVLFAEQRGQGSSGGEYMGFGMLERYDCLQWIAWVNEKTNAEYPVYLVGISMGATTVLMTGNMDLPSNVRGIMADCGFTSANDIWEHVAEKNLHIRYRLYARTANRLCKKKIQVGAKDCSTLKAMEACKVPVLLIHGQADSFVPAAMTYRNYEACSAPKRLLIVPNAEHGMSYCVDRTGYEKTILDFWQTFD